MIYRCKKDEQGTVLLEGVFAVFACIIVLMLMLSLGFYIYQNTMLGIVTNEVAEEIVHIYKYENASDASNITKTDVGNVGNYRYLFFSTSYALRNETKAKNMVDSRLAQTSFAKRIGTANVDIEQIADDLGRMHYEVTVSQEYEFLMGDLLQLLGLNGTETLSSTAYVESVDISNYINVVKMTNYGLDKFTKAVPLVNMVNSVVKMMKAIYNIF